MGYDRFNRRMAREKIKRHHGQTITMNLIEILKTPAGGWTRDFFFACGEEYPARKGWIRRIIGRKIDATLVSGYGGRANPFPGLRPGTNSVATDGAALPNKTSHSARETTREEAKARVVISRLRERVNPSHHDESPPWEENACITDTVATIDYSPACNV